MPSRIPVVTDSRIIRVRVDGDNRLAAAVGGAARYLADLAGLTSEVVSQLQTTVVGTCRESFGYLTEAHPWLEVTLTRFSDRIEVAFGHVGEASPAVERKETGASAVQLIADAKGSAALASIDEIHYERQGDLEVTRLTKYIREDAQADKVY